MVVLTAMMRLRHVCVKHVHVQPLSNTGESKQILVVGGWENTTEILTLSCTNTTDRGQWTQNAPLSEKF